MEPHEEFICTSGPERRLISIYNRAVLNGKRESGACRVDYTKNGKTKTVWTSKTDRAYCLVKALSLVTKLVEGNYSCKPESIDQADETETPEQAPSPGDTSDDNAKLPPSRP